MSRWTNLTVFFFVVSTQAHAGSCESYLKKDVAGQSVGVKRIESLKGYNASLYDVSDSVRERRLPTDKRINIFKIDDVFAEGRAFMGFGRPNVFIAFPAETAGEDNWVKFDAKSFRREDSKVVNTRGFVQSGVLLVFKDKTKATRIFEAAKRLEGTRQMTCVNANCGVLSAAGVTIGGESLEDYYFPGRLLSDALRFGLEMDGKPLEFDVVRVNPDFLEEVGLSIDRAVGTTFCRHAERACEAKDAAARNTWLTSAKVAGRRVLGLFLGQPTNPKDRRVLESAIVRLPPELDDSGNFNVRVSQPSAVGTLLRLLWGPHSSFEISLDPAQVDQFLPDILPPFPQSNPNWATRLKKHVLFSKPVVELIRSQLAASYRSFENISAGDLFGMLRTDTPETPNRYNIVITGTKVALTKLSVRMKLVDWLLSKHMIISGYSNDERYGGEGRKTADGVFHLNRNSGTLQPSPGQLEKAAELLRQLLPNVPIVIDDEL